MKDQFLRARVSQDIIDKVAELVEYYSSTAIGTINKTTVIELAINELYKKMKDEK